MKLYTDRHPRGEDLGPGNGRKAGVGGWRIEPVMSPEKARRAAQLAEAARRYRERQREAA